MIYVCSRHLPTACTAPRREGNRAGYDRPREERVRNGANLPPAALIKCSKKIARGGAWNVNSCSDCSKTKKRSPRRRSLSLLPCFSLDFSAQGKRPLSIRPRGLVAFAPFLTVSRQCSIFCFHFKGVFLKLGRFVGCV